MTQLCVNIFWWNYFTTHSLMQRQKIMVINSKCIFYILKHLAWPRLEYSWWGYIFFQSAVRDLAHVSFQYLQLGSLAPSQVCMRSALYMFHECINYIDTISPVEAFISNWPIAWFSQGDASHYSSAHAVFSIILLCLQYRIMSCAV
jgi:hypothetical protein